MAKAPPRPMFWPSFKPLTTTTVFVDAVPAGVTDAWRGLWHAIGQNLPHSINQSRHNRRALRGALKRNG